MNKTKATLAVSILLMPFLAKAQSFTAATSPDYTPVDANVYFPDPKDKIPQTYVYVGFRADKLLHDLSPRSKQESEPDDVLYICKNTKTQELTVGNIIKPTLGALKEYKENAKNLGAATTLYKDPMKVVRVISLRQAQEAGIQTADGALGYYRTVTGDVTKVENAPVKKTRRPAVFVPTTTPVLYHIN